MSQTLLGNKREQEQGDVAYKLVREEPCDELSRRLQAKF